MKSLASVLFGMSLLGICVGANAQSTGSTIVLQCSSSQGGTCTATGNTVPQSSAVRTFGFVWRGENIIMTPIDGKSVTVQCLSGQRGRLTATSTSGSGPAGEASATVTIDCSSNSTSSVS